MSFSQERYLMRRRITTHRFTSAVLWCWSAVCCAAYFTCLCSKRTGRRKSWQARHWMKIQRGPCQFEFITGLSLRMILTTSQNRTAVLRWWSSIYKIMDGTTAGYFDARKPDRQEQKKMAADCRINSFNKITVQAGWAVGSFAGFTMAECMKKITQLAMIFQSSIDTNQSLGVMGKTCIER